MDSKELMLEEVGIYEDVKGHRILIKALETPQKSTGGIILVDEFRNNVRATTRIGKVIGMGSTCFREQDTFPDGPLCAVGDYVRYSSKDRDSSPYKKHQMYYINDRQILSTMSKETAEDYVAASMQLERY